MSGTQRRVVSSIMTTGVPYDDLGRAIGWLTGVMGMRVAKMWGPEGQPVFAYLAWRDAVLSVAVRPPPDNDWSVVGPVSIELTAPDDKTVRDAYQRALKAGADVVRELDVHRNPAAPDGYLGFQLRDAEGNLWGMGTWGPRYEVTSE